jgi:hypothetical protein
LPKAAVEEITEYEEKIKELKNVMDFLEKYKNN